VIACQSTLESKIRQVLASDQDEVIFTDPIEGIWFGSLNKVKGNISLPPTYTKDDADYSSHLHRIMNSPPKKRPNSNLKHGGGLPPSTSSPYPNHNSSPSPTINIWVSQTITTTLNQRFELIYNKINQQRECNARFNDRISSLEVITPTLTQKWIIYLIILPLPSHQKSTRLLTIPLEIPRIILIAVSLLYN